MAQIVGIGANVKDTLFQLETYPTQDTKQGAKTVKEAGGGPLLSSGNHHSNRFITTQTKPTCRPDTAKRCAAPPRV